MRRQLGLVAGLALFLATALVHGQSQATGFLDRSTVINDTKYLYQVYVPRDYDGARPWPLILYLHGCGDSNNGTDGIRQTHEGLAAAIRGDVSRFPAIAVFPQIPWTDPRTTWLEIGATVARTALDRTVQEFRADKSRIYLMGFSCGGNGAWKLAYLEPDRYAALVTISGWARQRGNGRGTVYPAIAVESTFDEFKAVAERVATIPTWILHGAVDPQVSVEESRGMAAVLKNLGANVRYSELAGVTHSAQAPALAMEELSAWLFQQRRR